MARGGEGRGLALVCAIGAACGDDGPSADAGSTSDGSATSPTTSTTDGSTTSSTSGTDSSSSGVDASSSGGDPGYQPDVAWTFAFLGPWDQIGLHVRPLPDGSVIFAGEADDTTDLGEGPFEPVNGHFLAILDAQGQYVRAFEPGNVGAIAVTGAGDIAVAEEIGGGSSHVRMQDVDGNELWVRSCGPGFVTLHDVDVDADGNVVVAGWFSDTLDLGNGAVMNQGAADSFIAKLDPAGAPLWVDAFGGPDGEYGRGVAIDAAGEIRFAGHFLTTIDLGGELLMGEDGNFVAGFDAQGQHVWSEGFDFGAWEVRGFAIDGTGAVVLLTGGVLQPGELLKLDPAGATLWQMSSPVSPPFGLAVDPDGTIFVGGSSGQQWGVTKLDPDGTELWRWEEGFGGAVGMSVDAQGDLLVAGFFSGEADFGTGPLVAVDMRDGIVLKVVDP